eukprot:TRINITY_DN23225_c0_g1_i1.p1 TRINITY_DN23225_c0_g1~~TRINITY_DN23225_c0_g1_i1.p1  ORF type:complete len:619 (+),score=222.28 TRINITY_DN23225_c0_g1_i1:92-1858(+)
MPGKERTVTEKDIAWMQDELNDLTCLMEAKEHELIEALEGLKGEAAVKALEAEIEAVATKRDAYATVVEEKMRQHQSLDTPAKKLVMLVYTSTHSRGMSEEDISMITARSYSKNKMLGVTGVLAFSVVTGQFVQVLEGDEGKVDILYQRIARDNRHTNVSLVRRQPIEARRFPDWPMFSLDLVNYDPPEQPLQTILHLLAQNSSILSRCSQKCMKDVLTKGGNPLFVQPKRRCVITMLVGLHNLTEYTMLSVNPQAIADVLDTFSKVVEMCITAYGGTVVNANAGRTHAQWEAQELPRARDAMQTIIDTVKQRRIASILPSDAHNLTKSKLPAVPLFAHAYPCVVLSYGDVLLTPISSSSQTMVDVVGPGAAQAKEMLDTGMRERLQLLLAPPVKQRMEAYLKSFHVDEVIPLGKTFVDVFYTVKEVEPVPQDVPESLSILASELSDMQPVVYQVSNATDEAHDAALAEAAAAAAAAAQAPSADAAGSALAAARELTPQHDVLHHPPPPKSYSDRVFLSQEELAAQFDILDVNKNGKVSRQELNRYCDRFDSMGLNASFDEKIQRVLGDRQDLSFHEFSILMLRMAQD